MYIVLRCQEVWAKTLRQLKIDPDWSPNLCVHVCLIHYNVKTNSSNASEKTVDLAFLFEFFTNPNIKCTAYTVQCTAYTVQCAWTLLTCNAAEIFLLKWREGWDNQAEGRYNNK